MKYALPSPWVWKVFRGEHVSGSGVCGREGDPGVGVGKCLGVDVGVYSNNSIATIEERLVFLFH